MKISLNWLSDLVEIPDRAALPSLLTFAGLEVEAVEQRGQGLEKVVVGRIRSSKPHPKADKLSVTEVDAGGAPLQIVCGAKNYKVGDLVPVALPGARLPGGMEIAEAELRGVKSAGMLCSQRELGLSEAHEGLFILPASAKPGQKLTDALPLADTVLEINVTPNRGDCLSHLGIAREVAALTGGARRLLDSAQVTTPLGHPLKRPHIAEPSRCERISMLPVHAASDMGAPSPFWMQNRLASCGIRPLGLAIDVTNYVLLELGQPLHAYDLDKLTSGIVVRLAKAGEKIETLDGTTRELSADDLVICDGQVPVGLAGVMGGASTRVIAGTRHLYLEAATFTPSGVRRTAKRHALPSEASHRFERGVDPELPGRALARAAALIAACAPGSTFGALEATEAVAISKRKVSARFARVEQLLGLPLGREQIVARLASIGVERRGESRGPGGDQAEFEVPSHRLDLTEPVDLVSEVGRLVGYDKIPARLPSSGAPAPAIAPRAALRETLRAELLGAGFAETVQYSFFSGKLAEAFAAGDGTTVTLVNPLKGEQASMRESLLPSLCDAAKRNLAYLTRDAGVAPSVKLFELASVYRWPRAAETPEGPAVETPHLGLLWHGPRAALGWGNGRELADVFDLKGVLERLFGRLRAPLKLVPAERRWLHPRSSAEVWSGDLKLGVFGELHPGLAAEFELPKQLLLCELDVAAMERLPKGKATPRAPKFPAVLRDIALVVDAALPAERVTDCLRSAGGTLLESLLLFDVYQGSPLAASEKSLAFSLRFRAEDRTLTDAEVAAVHTQMVAQAGAVLGARLRA